LQQGQLLAVGLQSLLQSLSLLAGLHLVEMQPGMVELVVWGFHLLALLVVGLFMSLRPSAR
jgi:hypothetical protein